MNTVEIFKGNDNSTLQAQINEWFDSMPGIKITNILQSESNEWVTISIFYKTK